MAIYSQKHAKQLIPESICIDKTSYVGPTGLKVRAVLAGESKPRSFHICALLADGGKREIQELMTTLKAKDKKPTVLGVNSGDNRRAEPGGRVT